MSGGIGHVRPPATALRAVLFDMDGLLVDSERLWFEVERDVMARLGAEWREDDQVALVGGSIGRTVRYMLERSGSTADPEAVGRWLLDDMSDRLRSEVPLRPGAEKLLDEVAGARVPRALVSSAHRALIDPVLDALGPDRFDVTVAGDEVGRTKPDPEPYLVAARLLGARPGDCVALEDSPNGVASAEAAGCVTVAVPSVVPIQPAPGRTVVRSLHEVDLALLEALVGGTRG